MPFVIDGVNNHLPSKPIEEGILVYALRQNYTRPVLTQEDYDEIFYSCYNSHGFVVLWLYARKAGRDFEYNKEKNMYYPPHKRSRKYSDPLSYFNENNTKGGYYGTNWR